MFIHAYATARPISLHRAVPIARPHVSGPSRNPIRFARERHPAVPEASFSGRFHVGFGRFWSVSVGLQSPASCRNYRTAMHLEGLAGRRSLPNIFSARNRPNFRPLKRTAPRRRITLGFRSSLNRLEFARPGSSLFTTQVVRPFSEIFHDPS